MHSGFTHQQIFILIINCMFVTFLCGQPAQGKVVHKHMNNKFYLVPPPPPYVPSMLPELSRYQGSWRYSSYQNSRIGSAQTYKPNKYLTYVK